MASPADSRFPSAAIVESVGGPAGTTTHTTRGAVRAAASASSDATPRAPALSARAIASALRSYATMSCPPRTNRVTMFRPIRPRPTKPSCIVSPGPGPAQAGHHRSLHRVRLTPDTTEAPLHRVRLKPDTTEAPLHRVRLKPDTTGGRHLVASGF